MKKLIKYIFCISLFIGIFGFFNVIEIEAEENTGYLSWDNQSEYLLTNDLDSAPLTVEATIRLKAGYTERAGVILSNYNGSAPSYITFEIFENGNPSITMVDKNGIKTGGLYKTVNVATGEWVHLSFVINGSKHLCYIDGELKETKVFNDDYEEYIPLTRLAVGGDRRADKSQYFKGEIAELAIYSDIRNAEEIKEDYLSEDMDNDNLMVGYDFSNSKDKSVIEDISSNNNDLRKQEIEEVTDVDLISVGDFDYSIAVVGDTQKVNHNRKEYMKTIYDYIVDNVENFKIKHVAGMGDITDNSEAYEYTTAIEQFERMDGLVSYSLIRGNHDSSATFEQYLGNESEYSNYSVQYKAYYKNSTNTIHEFSAGNLDYLLVTLDFGPSDDVLEWASEQIAAHPYHNVIVSTHGYMDSYGQLIRKSNTGSILQHGGNNEGVDIWEKLISQHENIVLVLCGHINAAEVKVSRVKGVHGNLVTQMLINTQDQDKNDISANGNGYGMVSMLYFSNGGKTIDFRNYATIKGYYYKTYNQFRMNINVIQRKVNKVRDEINNLSDISIDDEEKIYNLNELYLSLSDEEKATIDATKLVEAVDYMDKYNAQLFDAAILELQDKLTYDNEEEILLLKEIYDKSSNTFKENLTQKELYEKKINELLLLVNQRDSKIINNEILYLSYPLTLADKNKVEELRTRYEKLDDESKKNVAYISKLEEAEAIITIHEQQKEEALAVEELINNLPEVIDLSCEEDVVSVRLKYSKLDSIAKEQVTNLDILEEAEAKILDAHSKRKAKELNEMILSLPDDVSLADKAVVEVIRLRYESLDEECKEYVSELFLLETFEARIKLLEELKVNVDVFNEKIAALPEIITLKDKAVVEELLEEYNNLSNDEKQLVTNVKKLNSAVETIKSLETPSDINIESILIISGSIIGACVLGFVVLLLIKKSRKGKATNN